MNLNARMLSFAVTVILALTLALPAAAQDGTPLGDIDPASQVLPLPLTGIKQVAAGLSHTCVLTTRGAVKCWGANHFGQLGNDSAAAGSVVPVDVTGLDSGVIRITAGSYHVCALTAGGAVKCWGYNFYGQLGDDNAGTNSVSPVNVVGLDSGVADVAAGTAHTCALLTNGGVKCWGLNDDGQLGDGKSPNDRDTPDNVVGLSGGVTAIAVGSRHTCALSSVGAVKCWGRNASGQLGDGKGPNDSDTPVDVIGLVSEQTAISAGANHTCSLTDKGGIMCWGENLDGQLGDGESPVSNDTPVDVVMLDSGVTAIAAGGFHTCALTGGGGVKCWGENLDGQLGDGNYPINRDTPGDVVGLGSGVAAIAAGRNHTCALSTGGGVKCWGYNEDGQLGDGTHIGRSLPGDVLAPATCYQLTRSKTGSGAAPAADPANTPGCPANHYLPGQIVTLLADSAAGFRVNGWTGTANNATLNEVNYLVMPAQDRAVSVTYAQCHMLTRKHTGAGGDPVAVDDRSLNCPENTYVAGQIMALIAKPNLNQRVQAWTGANIVPSTGEPVNYLTMPDADHTVSAAYETCFTLSGVIIGQGEPITAKPAASAGCVASSSFAAGEAITLTAKPAPGWAVQGWSGTTNDDSTATANQVTMPAADAVVGVTYMTQPAGPPVLFLPAVRR